MREVKCIIHETGFDNHLEFDTDLPGFKDSEMLVYHKVSTGCLIVRNI